ncbi:unnamed protein product, partial [Closterium sp. NIES-54]
RLSLPLFPQLPLQGAHVPSMCQLAPSGDVLLVATSLVILPLDPLCPPPHSSHHKARMCPPCVSWPHRVPLEATSLVISPLPPSPSSPFPPQFPSQDAHVPSLCQLAPSGEVLLEATTPADSRLSPSPPPPPSPQFPSHGAHVPSLCKLAPSGEVLPEATSLLISTPTPPHPAPPQFPSQDAHAPSLCQLAPSGEILLEATAPADGRLSIRWGLALEVLQSFLPGSIVHRGCEFTGHVEQ